jgi:hypothetical protein
VSRSSRETREREERTSPPKKFSSRPAQHEREAEEEEGEKKIKESSQTLGSRKKKK